MFKYYNLTGNFIKNVIIPIERFLLEIVENNGLSLDSSATYSIKYVWIGAPAYPQPQQSARGQSRDFPADIAERINEAMRDLHPNADTREREALVQKLENLPHLLDRIDEFRQHHPLSSTQKQVLASLIGNARDLSQRLGHSTDAINEYVRILV